ncbi:MAG: SCO family protein [Chloroflexota bacterium]|nr:SCO family protein [Chloroflexota bacterium]
MRFWTSNFVTIFSMFILLHGCSSSADGIVTEEPTESGLFADQIDFAPEFTLVDQFGADFSLTEKRGENIILFFGYTYCPDICPTVLSKLVQLIKDERYSENLSVIFISVDYEMDTGDRIEEYLRRFDKSIIGLTGTDEQLKVVKSDYGAYSSNPSNSNGESQGERRLTHSDYIYLIDQEGFLVGYYNQDTSLEILRSDLDILRSR